MLIQLELTALLVDVFLLLLVDIFLLLLVDVSLLLVDIFLLLVDVFLLLLPGQLCLRALPPVEYQSAYQSP